MYSRPKIVKNIFTKIGEKMNFFLAKKSAKMTIFGYLFKSIFPFWHYTWKCLRILCFLRIFHWGPKGKNIDWHSKKKIL